MHKEGIWVSEYELHKDRDKKLKKSETEEIYKNFKEEVLRCAVSGLVIV